jgi:hypothetical protein
LDVTRNLWIGAARMLLTICIAIATAWAASRVNRNPAAAMIDPDVDHVLKRHIGDITISVHSLKGALADLSTKSGVTFKLDDDQFSKMGGPPESSLLIPGPPPEPLRLRNASLGTALAAVLTQFDSSPAALTYTIEPNAVSVHPADVADDPSATIVRAYDVRDLLDSAAPDAPRICLYSRFPTDREAAAIALSDLIQAFILTPGDWPARVQITETILVLQTTPAKHRDVQRLLLALTHSEAGSLAHAKSTAIAAQTHSGGRPK